MTAADVEKYTRNFVFKTIQSIVHSRKGKALSSRSAKQTSWFNLAVPERVELASDLKKQLPEIDFSRQTTLNVFICLDSGGIVTELEQWTIHIVPASPSNGHVYSLYNRLALMLKSVMVSARTLPSYRLSREQEKPECDFKLRADVVRDSPKYFNLGEDPGSIELGTVNLGAATLGISCDFRTQFVVPPTRVHGRNGDNGSSAPIAIKQTRVPPQGSAGRLASPCGLGSSPFIKVLQDDVTPFRQLADDFFPESHATALFADDSDVTPTQSTICSSHLNRPLDVPLQWVVEMSQSISLHDEAVERSRTAVPALVDAERTPTPERRAKPVLCAGLCPLAQSAVPPSNPRYEVPSSRSLLFDIDSSDPLLREFSVLSTAPFSDETKYGELSVLYRTCKTAPLLHTAVDCGREDIVEQIETFEESVGKFDSFLSALCDEYE